MGLLDRLLGRKAQPVILEGNTDLDVVGESHYQDSLLNIAGGRSDISTNLGVVAVLVAEPSNPYDSNAVAVMARGLKVGYLPRDIAAKYQKHVIELEAKHGRPIALCGTVVGGWDAGDGDVGYFGISLKHNPSDFS